MQAHGWQKNVWLYFGVYIHLIGFVETMPSTLEPLFIYKELKTSYLSKASALYAFKGMNEAIAYNLGEALRLTIV